MRAEPILLVPRSFSASRRFPHLSWAWPGGARELLLIAAAHADENRAAEAFLAWQATMDIDACEFADQRLLVRIADRFPESRLKMRERARLSGIVRQLWTRSRLSLDSAMPALKALREAGVELVVLKGMALSALDIRNLKGRIAHDVDFLIRPADVATALSVLDGAGWRSVRGESGLFLQARGASFRSLNFVKPPFGDIDLHTRAYLTTRPGSEAETGLWSRATRASLLGTDVLVPSPTDRLVNAIAHGSLDAHHHSDWLVDCAQAIGEGGFDWSLVVSLANDGATPAQLMLALSYLSEVLGHPVPKATLDQLWERTRRRPADYYTALLLGRPREAHSPVTSFGRRLCKMRHGADILAADAAAAAGRPATPRFRLRRVNPPKAFPDTPPALRHRLAVPRGATQCAIVVGVEASDRGRRYVFEVNTSDRHLARLRFRDLLGRDRLCLGASIPLPADVAADDVWIEARQSGVMANLSAEDEAARFGPRPFRLLVPAEAPTAPGNPVATAPAAPELAILS